MTEQFLYPPNYSEMTKLAERAAKAESALRSIRALAEESSFGGWRFKVAAIIDAALSND